MFKTRQGTVFSSLPGSGAGVQGWGGQEGCVGGDLVSYLALPSWCPAVLYRPQSRSGGTDQNEAVLGCDWHPTEMRQESFDLMSEI